MIYKKDNGNLMMYSVYNNNVKIGYVSLDEKNKYMSNETELKSSSERVIVNEVENE